MNGLEYLPGISKDRITPVFLLAPWANSRTLEQAVERVQRAYPLRKYILDLDRDYIPSNPDSPAQTRWLELNTPANRFEQWRNFWSQFEYAIPCLQLAGQSRVELDQQIQDIQLQGREFCLRIELFRPPTNLADAIQSVIDLGTADFCVVLEGGWTADPLSLAARFNGLIQGIFSRLDGRIPIVVSCTSMPKGFQDISGVASVDFDNRSLVEQIQRATNRTNIVYGDWGSTRPREASHGRTPLPRIDYPQMRTWHIARNRDEDWDYSSAAREIVDSPFWEGTLGIWGEQQIELTATDQSFAINSPHKNVASRVNIHLHRQALYGVDPAEVDLDDDWVDF
ncbi:MAG: beta family protein [Labrenzia sp.]